MSHLWLVSVSESGLVFQDVRHGKPQRVLLFESYHRVGVGEFCRNGWIERLIVSDDLKTSVRRVEERLLHDFQCQFPAR